MMARDTRAEYERRNERARALGFTGYGQQRAARREGYKSAGQYQAAVKARAADRALTRAVAAGRLLGGTKTRAGTVIAARGDQLGELQRAIERYGDGRRFTVTVETKAGDVVHLGGHGGFSKGYMSRVGGLGDLIEEAAGNAYEGLGLTMPEGAAVITVTVV